MSTLISAREARRPTSADPVCAEAPVRQGVAELDRVVARGSPALVVFERPGSEACGSLAPALEEVAAEFAGRATIVRVADLDEEELLARHAVSEVPTLTFWSEGRECTRLVGTIGPAAIRAHLQFLVEQGFPPTEDEGAWSVQARDGSFQRLVLGESGPVIVVFSSARCASSRGMTALVESLARARGPDLRVVEAETEACPRWTRRLGLGQVPTLVLFRDGHEAERLTGIVPRRELELALDRLFRPAT